MTPENLAHRAGYFSPVVDGVRYTIDYFNPANELGMPYRDAGEPVLALLLQSTEPASVSHPRLVRDHLPDSFAAVLRDFTGIVRPKGIHGCYSLMSVLVAFLEGRAAARYSPWDFLFQLHLVKDPPIPLTPDTRISGRPVGMLPGKEVALHHVEDYGERGVLIQVKRDLNSDISWEYFAVAQALGMHCIQELCEGTVI